MSEPRLVSENLEQLNGHIRLVRQGIQNGIAAASSAFASTNREAAAGLAVDICNDVAALCDYCMVIAGMLLDHTEGAEHEQVLQAISTIEELSTIASRTKRIAEIESRHTGLTTIHPSIRGTLRSFAERVAAGDGPAVRMPTQRVHRAG